MNPLDRLCQQCGRLPGQLCMTSSGKTQEKFHMHRITGMRRSVEAQTNNRIRNRELYRARKQGAGR